MDAHQESPLDREFCLERANAIALQLLSVAKKTPSGGLVWMGPRGYGTEFNPLQVDQLPPYLYAGVSGIALFFAYLARVGGDPEAVDVCHRILTPVRRWLAEKRTALENPKILPQVGALVGIGSLIYAFQRISELLGDPELHQEALALVPMLTAERIAKDVQGRIQTGSAGAILALLALPPAARGELVRAKAAACGERLLELRIPTTDGAAGWALSPGKPPILGLYYGAAGVGFALRRLAAELDDARFAQAADQADGFVRHHFSAELDGYIDPRVAYQWGKNPIGRTWQDWWVNGLPDALEAVPVDGPFRPTADDLVNSFYCHGSVGIAAARIAALELRHNPEIDAQIDMGLRTAISLVGQGEADLCCGDAGRVDILFYAARRLQRPELQKIGERNLLRILAKADAEGGFLLSAARGRDIPAPTLFQGLAGLGYILLRAVAPELPCVLILE